jgi:CxxC-x17-CxxC domain-containing protein
MDCGQTFAFTEAEKAFFAQKGFVQPKRCQDCRKKKKASSRRPGSGGPKQLYDVTCCDCNCATQVPFKPKEGLPVYCKECFTKRKESGQVGRSSKTATAKAKDIPTIPESKGDSDEKDDGEAVEMEHVDEEDSNEDFEEEAGED